MTSPTARVLSTVELLEHILSNGLSPREITRARQINSFFRACIDDSHTLLRKIFLEPIPLKDHEEYPASLFPDNKLRKVVTLHPAIITPVNISELLDFRRPSVRWSTPGLWQDMLISQPPAAEYRLLCRDWTAWFLNSPEQYIDVRIPGKTLGALREAIGMLGFEWELQGISGGEGEVLLDARSKDVRVRRKAGRRKIKKAEKMLLLREKEDVRKKEVGDVLG